MYLGLLLRIKRDREAKEAPKVAEEGSKCVSTKSTTKISTAVAAKANHEPKKFTAKSKERLAKLTSNNQPPPPGSDEEARKNALLIRIKKEREKKNEVKAKKDSKEAKESHQNGAVNLTDGNPPASSNVITHQEPGRVFADQPPPPGSDESSQNLALPVSPQFSIPPPPIAAQPPPVTRFSVPPPSLASNGQSYPALPDLTRPPPPPAPAPAPISDGNSRKRPHADGVVTLSPPSGKKPAAAEDPSSSGKTQLARVKAMVEKTKTPLCNVPYDGQLDSKEEATRQFLGKLRTRITVANGAAETYFWHRESCTGSFVKTDGIVRSPEVDCYRNKCNFAVGINPVGKQLTVGFRLKTGVVHVGPIDHLKHISDKMKRVVARVEGFLRELHFPPHDPSTSRGVWTELSVRLTKTGEMMIVFIAHPQSLSESQVTEVGRKLVKFSRDCLQPLENLTSLYLDGGKLEHLSGTLNVKEKVGDKLFQISPQSFFPFNVSIVEGTCEAISELAGLHAESTLVDVCCGTGTIAIYLSERCGQVLGIDLLPIAIEDARMNALSNDITNGEFHPGGAEEYLGTLWRRAIFNDVVRQRRPQIVPSMDSLPHRLNFTDMRRGSASKRHRPEGHKPPQEGGSNKKDSIPLPRKLGRVHGVSRPPHPPAVPRVQGRALPAGARRSHRHITPHEQLLRRHPPRPRAHARYG